MEISIRARIRAGDAVAFGQLFEEHARVVHRHAARMTGDRTVAEDVVSLTFLEAWRLRAGVAPEGESLRPWLLGIATNVIRNTRRAARRHQKALAKLPPHEVVPDFAAELTGRIADAEQLMAAKAALERLRPAEREVFALYVWEGLDHAAVAEALGKPVGTVRSRLSRARARLRELTDQELARERAERSTQRRSGSGQLTGDRALAVRSTKETIR
ncbi:RNA polymerase sigma-70 factor (ECF subfamily) [Kitasatospora gansuensis]|uniref:RNA polymerase sigma-70 factor (ECF subfamily) n=1 Tax=Kitasatospora gansuensis TaxID=258050 RepID=A0A7W7S799_9ACTN|nr:RNA polymerase sigma factor [Kitasatospora gansuensis]MBB4944842.1 RNA polymerase sigma-70 factor (ECF subfamily) [Kitasatospora gansuensis]